VHAAPVRHAHGRGWCVSDSDDTGCAAEVRVSTMDTERDLGWLEDGEPRLGR